MPARVWGTMVMRGLESRAPSRRAPLAGKALTLKDRGELSVSEPLRVTVRLAFSGVRTA